jgi:hypothetical protein
MLIQIDSNLSLTSEWLQNQHRDTLASYCGHNSLLSYFAVVENESISRLKARFANVFCYLLRK